MLSDESLRRLLLPFGLDLNSEQRVSLRTYLGLLMRWNKKINLTAIRRPEEMATRLFGESLYLAHWAELRGLLLDVGSGAGFPGLALKIPFPGLAVTLLEPVAKKRAFLKEVVRECQFADVEVRGERLESYEQTRRAEGVDVATSRALGHYEKLVPLMADCLKPGGSLFLWVTHAQGAELAGLDSPLVWQSPLRVPITNQGEIWHGVKKAAMPRR